MNILIIEDEEKLVDILKRALKAQYYTVDFALDGEKGLSKALKNKYSLIILDIMLPKKDGIQVCKELRKKGIQTPIIMLTARGVAEDRVKGLDAGADDYLLKPFEMDELFARIRAILRRPKVADHPVFHVSDLVLDTKSREVTRAKKHLDLTPKEYKLLSLLLTKKGTVITREELINQAWGPDFKEENHELNVHMRYLRTKVDKKNQKPLIQTVRGVGYTIKA